MDTNVRLKKIVADQALDMLLMKEAIDFRGKPESPRRRREMVKHLL